MKQLTYRIDKQTGLKSKDVLEYLNDIADITTLQSLFCTNAECKDSHIYLMVRYNAGLRQRRKKHSKGQTTNV